MKKKISNKSIMVAIVALGMSTLIYYGYQGSCLKNHSDAINELGKPIVQDVLAFYKENQRYPDLKESEVIFTKAGCNNLKQREYKESKNIKGEIYERWANYFCEYKYKTYRYGITVGDLSVDRDAEAYGFGFSKGKTRCHGNFFSTKIGGYFGCQQDSCINLSH